MIETDNGVGAIPLTRMDNADPALMDELLATVERIARSAAFTLGAEVEAFEDEFAAYCGTRHAVGVSSGTEASRWAQVHGLLPLQAAPSTAAA